MTLTVNGDSMTVEPPLTVAELLARMDLTAPCAVEVNRDLVPHRERADRQLQPDDRIEIVTLVGGG